MNEYLRKTLLCSGPAKTDVIIPFTGILQNKYFVPSITPCRLEVTALFGASSEQSERSLQWWQRTRTRAQKRTGDEAGVLHFGHWQAATDTTANTQQTEVSGFSVQQNHYSRARGEKGRTHTPTGCWED